MALPHGTIKSGQTRNVNRMGATNRMVQHVLRHRSNNRPVSINFLRVMLKNMNRTIDQLASEPIRQANMLRQKQCVYNAIRKFQDAYTMNDVAAIKAAVVYCHTTGVALPGNDAVTIRKTDDAVQRVAGMLGEGHFDSLGFHTVSREGIPRIPGGYNTGDRELLGAEIDKSEASVVFSPKSAEYHAEGRAKLQPYLQTIVRQAGGNTTIRRNGRDKVMAGEYQRANRGTRNMYFDRVEGKNVVISNAKVERDGKRR